MTRIEQTVIPTSCEEAELPPEAGQLELEEALRRLTAMIERDPRARRVENARRSLRAARPFGPATACIGS